MSETEAKTHQHLRQAQRRRPFTPLYVHVRVTWQRSEAEEKPEEELDGERERLGEEKVKYSH